MTARDIIARLLRLMTMRSSMLQLEWDTFNSKHDGALNKAFGSLDRAKDNTFREIYRIGYMKESEKDALVSMLSTKMPKVEKNMSAITPSFEGTEEWGKVPKWEAAQWVINAG